MHILGSDRIDRTVSTFHVHINVYPPLISIRRPSGVKDPLMLILGLSLNVLLILLWLSNHKNQQRLAWVYLFIFISVLITSISYMFV